jgi:ribosome maturation factor RimP
VQPVLAGLGCELWDLQLAGPPGRRHLRVYIDAPDGVDLELCARVARTLRPALDHASLGLDDADLEVSSPGAERPLRDLADYRRHVGERVRVRYRSDDSERVIEGPLTAVDEVEITVQTGAGEGHPVSMADVAEARLAVDFGNHDRPRRDRRRKPKR